MEPVVMVVIGLAIFALPFLLMWLFNGVDRTDSRGRRVDTGWRVDLDKAMPRPARRIPADPAPPAAAEPLDTTS